MPYENGRPIFICRGLQLPLDQIWPRFNDIDEARLATWDRFLVPVPFSRIGVRWGEPFRVRPEDDKAATGARPEAALNALQQRRIAQLTAPAPYDEYLCRERPSNL